VLRPVELGTHHRAGAGRGAATLITKHVLTNIPLPTLLVPQLTISVGFLLLIVFAQRLGLLQRRDMVRLGGMAASILARTFSLFDLTLTPPSMSTLL
jgi:hypothetical protein